MGLRLRHSSAINPRQNGPCLETNPSPTICCAGISAFGTYWLEDDGVVVNITDYDKPPYRVPLVSEINELPWNGFKVASTFSGAGGSCMGYRMAGFKVAWANEFVPAAQDSYNANKAPDCILDGRDIREVQAGEILEQTGLAKGELDLFDGSPPCQAFSTAGKGAAGWGEKKSYEGGASQCNELLFFEYVRLLKDLQPKTFVAENVSGLVKGKAKGMFKRILADLRASGYNVKCKLLDAQWLGVPQQRTRTIFVGVRNDLGLDPVHPKPLPYRYSVRDAIPHLFNSEVIHEQGGFSTTRCENRPSPAITATQCRVKTNAIEPEAWATEKQGEVYDLCEPGQRFSEVGMQVGYRGGFNKERVKPDKPSCAILAGCPGTFHPTERRKFSIAELRRICSFPDDFELCGSYAQQWERLGNSVPPVMMYHISSAIRDGILAKIR